MGQKLTFWGCFRRSFSPEFMISRPLLRKYMRPRRPAPQQLQRRASESHPFLPDINTGQLPHLRNELRLHQNVEQSRSEKRVYIFSSTVIGTDTHRRAFWTVLVVESMSNATSDGVLQQSLPPSGSRRTLNIVNRPMARRSSRNGKT